MYLTSMARTATGSTAAVMVPNRSAEAMLPNWDEVRPASLSPYKVNPAVSKERHCGKKMNSLAPHFKWYSFTDHENKCQNGNI